MPQPIKTPKAIPCKICGTMPLFYEDYEDGWGQFMYRMECNTCGYKVPKHCPTPNTHRLKILWNRKQED